MPLIVQFGKQRVPQGLPLPILCYAVGESQKILSDLRGRSLRLRSVSSEKPVEVETLGGGASPFLYDDFGRIAWWSVVATRNLPAGVYEPDFAMESVAITSRSAVLDEESYEKLLAEENEEQFDDNLRIPTSHEA